MAFAGVHRVSIRTAIFNTVQGTQINHHQIVQEKEEKKEHAIYGEFYEIKRGDIYRLKDVHEEKYSRRWSLDVRPHDQTWDTELETKRKISTAKIHQECDSRFLVVSYSGAGAKEAWMKDFLRFSHSRDSRTMQLFGINQSNVPSLVFYGDLVPVAQVLDDRVEKFGRCYLGTLLDNFRCPLPEIWIDSKQGTFVRGVGGPYCEIRSLGLNDESLPSCTQFLRDDVYLRYLSRFPLDRQFDRAVLNVHRLRSSSEDLYATTNQPHVLSGVTGSIIAVGGRIWEATGKCLNTQVQMPDGTMRFHLKDHKDRMFQLYSSRSEDECAWLSQASSVFDKLGISLDENLSNYQLITPVFWLQGWMMNSAIKRQRRLQGSPIYLFIPPIPLSPPLVSGTTVSVHIWSFDETGQAPISNESCEYLGLPVQLWLQVFQSSYQPSWPKETYQAIHKWQIARGFDPSSTNFARFLGYPVYHAQLDARRFEELDEGWVKV